MRPLIQGVGTIWMKRRTVNFTWEDEDAQAVFREWVPFPDANVSAQDVDRIETLLHLTPPLDVLDVGCGNGRHAIEMAKRGYRVVGIDVAKRFLKEAKKSAQQFGVPVEFRYQRASELTERDAFDFTRVSFQREHVLPRRGVPELDRVAAC